MPNPSKYYASATSEIVETRLTYRQSWCRRRTHMEMILLILLLLVLLGIIAAIIVFAFLSVEGSITYNSDWKSSTKVCLTEDCVKTAARILNSMDQTVQPCDDFFEYACGTWNKMNPIPEDRPNYSTFLKLDDELQAILRELLEKPVLQNETLAIRNAKWLYQSCLNTSLLQERKEGPLLRLIEDLGNWPVLDRHWDERRFNVEDQMVRLKLLNHPVLINMDVSSDDKHSQANIIQMDQGPLGLQGREYYLKGREDKTLMIYEQVAVNIAVALGAQKSTAEREMRDMIDLEIRLASITMPSEQRRDNEALYHKFSVEQLSKNLTKEIDWQRYLGGIMSNVSIDIGPDEPVVVYAPEYMKQLGALLKTVNKRTLANYMIWHLVMSRVNYLHQVFIDLLRVFNKAQSGTEQERPRWQTCTSYVNDNLGMAVGRMFIEKHFDEKAKTNAVEMIEQIRKSFAELLQEITWMGEDTKIVAQEKVDAIREKIGYPDYIKNDTALNLDYEGLQISSDKYFENVNSIMHLTSRKYLLQLRHEVDREKWSTAPAVVNAFYSASKNLIMFPAGILHPPFYHENYPMYLNFGGIAMVIGHEITHGFDDKGRQYDKDGNLKQWWSEEDIENFKEKAQCMVDQYSNYTVQEANMNINGKQTQGENIADNGGLKQAYRAYRSWVDINGPEATLPGIPLNQNQLFFLSFAQMWCGSSRPENYVYAIRVGKHSPGKIRVRGSLSNSKDFAEVYNCPSESPQNPANKCSVW